MGCRRGTLTTTTTEEENSGGRTVDGTSTFTNTTADERVEWGPEGGLKAWSLRFG